MSGSSLGMAYTKWTRGIAPGELSRIAYIMRALRASRARRHVRPEAPFYTGTRKEIAELVADLP